MNATTRSPLAVTASVGRALFLRELMTRLAAGRAAWLWLLLEPLAHIVFLMLLFSTLRSRLIVGADFAEFLALGVLGFFAFRNTAQRSMEAIGANSALFAYRQILPVDTVAVRILLEGALAAAVTLILFAGIDLFGTMSTVADPLGVLTGFLGLWGFGAGIGLVLSVAQVLLPELARTVKLLFTPLYFVSGVMFSPHVLPAQAQTWMAYNPIVHGLEAMRGAYFQGYVPIPAIKLGYLYFWDVMIIVLGLMLHQRYRRRLVAL